MTSSVNHRYTNFELFRIILMLIIIAHHYVVNSGITKLFNYDDISFNMLFLVLFGFGGKIAINCFVLITGYFMIKKEFYYSKILKIYGEVKFYKIAIFICMCYLGYTNLDTNSIFYLAFSVIYAAVYGRSFPEVYLLLLFLIPFLNKFLLNSTRKEILCIIGCLVIYFSVIWGIFPNLKPAPMHYIGWFITVYFIGAYIRLYENEFQYFNKNITKITFLYFIMLFLSIIVICVLNHYFNFRIYYYYFVIDANKITALIAGVLSFLTIKNSNVKYNKYINWCSSSTLGILLIHANSNALRQFLWVDLLKVKSFYNNEYLILHALFSVLIVYTFCLFIDKVRTFFVDLSKKGIRLCGIMRKNIY